MYLLYFLILEAVILIPIYVWSILSQQIKVVIVFVVVIPPLLFKYHNNDINLGISFPELNIKYLLWAISLNYIGYFITYFPIWYFIQESYTGSPVYDLMIDILITSLIWIIVWCIIAIPEEITWRGYLTTELNNYRSNFHSSILIGLVWASFHYPFIFGVSSEFFNSYLIIPVWYSCIFFTLNLMCVSVIMGLLNKESNSILYPVLIHGIHNALVPVFVSRTTIEYQWLLGEGGIFTSLIWLLLTGVTYLITR